MVTKNTVLVLGAGASIPYNYPSGKELLIKICETLRKQDAQDLKIYALSKMGFTAKDMIQFRNALFFSGRNSVDAFLEWRSEHVEIGKACIAVELIPHELDSMLFEKENTSDWYNYIYDKMNTSFDSFADNRISIVTFNYDRSLEHYLFTSLKNSYGKNDAECAEKLSQIPIVHVHGVLGNLPWQNSSSRAYNYDVRD